jgi:hypothetical protein
MTDPPWPHPPVGEGLPPPLGGESCKIPQPPPFFVISLSPPVSVLLGYFGEIAFLPPYLNTFFPIVYYFQIKILLHRLNCIHRQLRNKAY